MKQLSLNREKVNVTADMSSCQLKIDLFLFTKPFVIYRFFTWAVKALNTFLVMISFWKVLEQWQGALSFPYLVPEQDTNTEQSNSKTFYRNNVKTSCFHRVYHTFFKNITFNTLFFKEESSSKWLVNFWSGVLKMALLWSEVFWVFWLVVRKEGQPIRLIHMRCWALRYLACHSLACFFWSDARF